MDSKQIDVMVADASHEVYVDTILDTIREAAKKRGTGHTRICSHQNERGESHYRPLWQRVCWLHLHRKLGQQAIRSYFWLDCPSQISGYRTSQAYQTGLLPPGTPPLAVGQDIQPYQRRGRHEDEHHELTDDEAFWKGCEGCINHDILVAKNRKFCICTAMLYDPALHEEDKI